MREVSATDARRHLGALLRDVSQKGETVLIEQRGRVAAALVPVSSLPSADADQDGADASWAALWRLGGDDEAGWQVDELRGLRDESYER